MMIRAVSSSPMSAAISALMSRTQAGTCGPVACSVTARA